MKRPTFSQWSIKHRYTLRKLYTAFLDESGATYQDWADGKVPSYADFQRVMWRNCKGGSL